MLVFFFFFNFFGLVFIEKEKENLLSLYNFGYKLLFSSATSFIEWMHHEYGFPFTYKYIYSSFDLPVQLYEVFFKKKIKWFKYNCI